MSDDSLVYQSSGNVFADLDLTDADDCLLRESTKPHSLYPLPLGTHQASRREYLPPCQLVQEVSSALAAMLLPCYPPRMSDQENDEQRRDKLLLRQRTAYSGVR
jgi:hypothetical protein